MLRQPWAKPVFFLLCCVPLVWILYQALWGDLGANPVETITHHTGEWTLRLLLLTLCLTPLRLVTGNPQWIRFRRMAGLFVFFYACLHFSVWFLADHSLDLSSMIEDVIKRPYISVGFTAFLMLIPLALTSNRFSMARLGKRWGQLHKLVYPIVMLGVLHFLWLVKADYLEPLIYLALTLVLLGIRLKPELITIRRRSAN